MDLKIISDGTPQGSRLVNAQTDEPVENVTFAEITIHAKEGVKATLRFEFLQVDVKIATPPLLRF